MKTKFSLKLCLAAFASISFLFCSCDKKDEAKGSVTYSGTVVYAKTTTPFPDLEVRLTDGSNVNTTTKTNSEGFFSVKVDLSTINGDYYFLVGDATCIQKKVEIPGWGQSKIDLGTIEVEGPTIPIVELDTVLAVATTSATFKGHVISDGRHAVTERGFCYAKTDYPTIDNNHKVSGKGIGEFMSSVSDLDVNSTYYVCAYATNEMGTAYSKTTKFTTSDGRPSVTTTDPGENITSTSIATGGNVTDDYGFTVTARGVVYSTLPYPTLENASKVKSGSGTGYFSANITNISPVDNTYYIRAYATNSNGTSYGEQIVITPDRSEYLNLPIVEYGGYRYHVYKDMGSMDWQSAVKLCDDLTFAGYDDWFLPDQYELRAIEEANIRGWVLSRNGSYYEGYYWSASTYSSSNAYYCEIDGSQSGTNCTGYWYKTGNNSKSTSYRVRPVRKDKLK